MTDKPDRVPDRIRDIQEAIKNAREDIGDLSKEGFCSTARLSGR